LICAINAAAAVLFVLAPVAPARGASCDSTKELISNDMIALAGNSGSGDTLWIAGNDPKAGLGVNDTVSGSQGWGQYLGCYESFNLQSFAFGGRTVAALLYPVTSAGSNDSSRPNILWHHTLGTAIQDTFVADTIQFSLYGDSVNPTNHDTTFVAPPAPIDSFKGVNTVYAGGKFFTACQRGGVVVWNPAAIGPQTLTGLLPGDPVPFPLDSINPNTHPKFATAAAAVRSVDRYGVPADSAVVAATGSRIWLLNYAHDSWDSTTITTALSDPGKTFDSVSEVFVNNNSPAQPPILYAVMYYSIAGANKRDSALFRYHYFAKKWSLLVHDPLAVITPATRGCLYAVSTTSENSVQIYRDSLPDSVVIATSDLPPLISATTFASRFNTTVNPRPQQIDDIAFIPTHDSTGHLYIATADGLFSYRAEVPGMTTDTLSYTVRPTKTIAAGLSQTYALPGILTNGSSGLATYTTFVYKLTRDANVTIEVFDYNMQLTRLVINNQPRKASTTTGRSTNAALDIWNGTNDAGRMVAPGVYYYKITASTGERSFGKIVVAKTPGN
jgi:hypothetical protein